MLRRFPNDLRWLPILRWSLGWDSATPPALRFRTRLWWPAAWVAPRRSTCRHLQPVLRAAHRHIQAHLAEHGRLTSEEHTSELQSPCNLVCRLLLEKKKT